MLLQKCKLNVLRMRMLNNHALTYVGKWEHLISIYFHFLRKIYMYSAHDTTVAPILHTLGVFNNIAPPYASMVMVELHDLGSNSLHVKVLYHNDSSVPPYVMTIPGCQELCPLNKFKGKQDKRSLKSQALNNQI